MDGGSHHHYAVRHIFEYRAEILDAAHEGVPLIVDCHSFPSDVAPDVDVCLGFNEDSSRPSQETIDLVAQTFRTAGYSVALNRPYANALAPVGYIGHSLMIEVNKHTYMDEQTLKRNTGFDHLKHAIDSVCRELLWMRLNKPRNFSCPWNYPFGGTDEARTAAWEAIKSSIVEFTAARYGVAMPEDLGDSDKMCSLRRKMESVWGAPSWTRSLAWLQLANEMLRSVFGRIDVTLPGEAFVQHYMHPVTMPQEWRERFREAL